MIVFKDKSYETCSLYPNSDWYNEGNYVIDETTINGRVLAQKIIKHAPYMDLVIEDGKLVDIIPTERPPKPEPTPPEPEPTPPEPTLTEIQEQQLAQAEAIAAIFERLEGGA